MYMTDEITDPAAEEETVRTVEVDVVVVGAGPAGCVLSNLLARSGVETLLLERQSSLDREFRGFGFQPSTLRIFDDMDVLEDVLALDHEEVSQFGVDLYGHSRTAMDFTSLPAPHDFALMTDQPPLLRLLVDTAKRYETFEFHDATPVQDLIVEDGVVGVRATDREANESIEVRARVVVGSDGRFSTVRSVAGIDPGLYETDFQMVWLKVPGEVSHETQIRINEHGQLLYFGLGENVQIGWLIPEGTYPAIREAGIDAFRERIAAVDPRLRSPLESSLTGFDDCSLLNVAPGLSDEWVRDGLALVGDAAHVASPVGAQGNALAMQDAAVLHSVVVRALDRTIGPLSARDLRPYVQRRRPAVKRVIDAQLLGHRAISALVHHADDVPDIVLRGGIQLLLSLGQIDPMASRIQKLLALGPDPVRVERELFEEGERVMA
jgi:2-polyprenyl-6-methoxyphenol hydroxylase-like FAD-dependent oxidoreductase